ncbi:hypothetical protein Pcinc_039057, partial [Petrolisthes cinctipes]
MTRRRWCRRGVVVPGRGVAVRAVALLALMVCATPTPHQSLTPIYDSSLDLNDTHHLYWRLDYPGEEVSFEVHTKGHAKSPWLALGFSDRGELIGADLCVLWTDWHGRVHFQ